MFENNKAGLRKWNSLLSYLDHMSRRGKLQLVFAAEVVCEREQIELICIYAVAWRILQDLQDR